MDGDPSAEKETEKKEQVTAQNEGEENDKCR